MRFSGKGNGISKEAKVIKKSEPRMVGMTRMSGMTAKNDACVPVQRMRFMQISFVPLR
jgi:hypothetical protein